jgi:hypothetical protein
LKHIGLDPQESKIFSEKCRSEGVTVGSAVAAACIAAHEDISGPFTGNFKLVGVPFDLRRHATEVIGDVFCLFVGAARFPYTYDAKKPFWENTAFLHNEIHKRVNELDSVSLKALRFEPSFIDAFSSFGPYLKITPEAYSRTEKLSRFAGDTKNIAFYLHANTKT